VWLAIVRLNVPRLSQAPETDPTDGVSTVEDLINHTSRKPIPQV